MKTRADFARLTNKQLHRNVVSLVGQERECTLSVVDHLIEVERRRLYAELGHSSIYGYCTEELGYSRTAANRRIVAARTVRRFPRTRRLLAERQLTLSTLAAIGRELDGDNCRALLSRVCGKSTEETGRAIAELRGIRPVREKIQQVVTVSSRPAAAMPAAPTQPTLSQPVTKNEVRCGPQNAQTPEAKKVARAPVTEHRYRFEFSGDEAFMDLYRKAAAAVSNRLGGRVSIEETMRFALEALVDRDDPATRKVRRERRSAGRKGTRVKTQKQPRSRHVPAGIRDAVHERDGGQCTFVSDQGRRCGAVRNLHVDHVVPWAKGGTHEPDNLRLLCAAHNRLMAQREFGPGSIPVKRD